MRPAADAASLMPEASLDGMPLIDRAQGALGGGAFTLREASPASRTQLVDDRWLVEVWEGSRCVVVRGTPEANFEDALSEALETAQEGLDIFSCLGAADLAVTGVEDDHLAWWKEDEEIVIRAGHTATLNVTVGPVRAVVTDSEGNVKPDPPPPPIRWHESFRYFRLAQVTDDLIDAWRNLYLALESILSDIAPVRLKNGRPAEGEGEWLRRALTEASKVVELLPLAPPDTEDPIAALYNELYLETRTGIFHAKASRPHLLPHDAAHRRATTESLKRLTSLYLRLAEAELEMRRPSSFMFAGGFSLMTQHLNENVAVVVTDDPTPVSRETTEINPAGGHLATLLTRPTPEVDRPFLRTFLGTCAADQLSHLTHIAAIWTTDGGVLITAGIPEGRLTVGGLGRFEAQMGLQMRNARQPRTSYAM